MQRTVIMGSRRVNPQQLDDKSSVNNQRIQRLCAQFNIETLKPTAKYTIRDFYFLNRYETYWLIYRILCEGTISYQQWYVNLKACAYAIKDEDKGIYGWYRAVALMLREKYNSQYDNKKQTKNVMVQTDQMEDQSEISSQWSLQIQGTSQERLQMQNRNQLILQNQPQISSANKELLENQMQVSDHYQSQNIPDKQSWKANKTRHIIIVIVCILFLTLGIIIDTPFLQSLQQRLRAKQRVTVEFGSLLDYKSYQSILGFDNIFIQPLRDFEYFDQWTFFSWHVRVKFIEVPSSTGIQTVPRKKYVSEQRQFLGIDLMNEVYGHDRYQYLILFDQQPSQDLQQQQDSQQLTDIQDDCFTKRRKGS